MKKFMVKVLTVTVISAASIVSICYGAEKENPAIVKQKVELQQLSHTRAALQKELQTIEVAMFKVRTIIEYLESLEPKKDSKKKVKKKK